MVKRERINENVKTSIDYALSLNEKPILIEGVATDGKEEYISENYNSVIYDCSSAYEYDLKNNSIEGHFDNNNKFITPTWYDELKEKTSKEDEKCVLVFKDIQKLTYNMIYRLVLGLTTRNFNGNIDIPENVEIVCTNNVMIDKAHTSLLPDTISKYFNILKVYNENDIKFITENNEANNLGTKKNI